MSIGKLKLEIKDLVKNKYGFGEIGESSTISFKSNPNMNNNLSIKKLKKLKISFPQMIMKPNSLVILKVNLTVLPECSFMLIK